MTNGNDDRRNAPPADPWLETAPTSPLGSFPYAETLFDAPPAQRNRRWWWFALVALALVGCVGGLLLNPFSGSPSTEATAPPTSATAAPTSAAASASAAAAPARVTAKNVTRPPADEVVYLVTSTNKGDVASVSYTDQDRDIIRKGEVKLPWRHTFRITGDKPPLVIVAQRKQGGTGPVTCSITFRGKELSNAVQRGRYASPQCSG
ncbi:hypothetical protein [Paractinoplanes lichenicola]|uniref:MmpS family membrane protein n=1 Tax=Paractinoplanes lichenicola TaxID=2802976 RepID=A0ABS1VDN2_9ACTN|nr:hypothetical protein [Actinoplanes lichenicola]MBL7252803.1 hypothetical protein [Actinoplanes lichenicola]